MYVEIVSLMVDHTAVAAICLLIGVRWIDSCSAVMMWFGVSIVGRFSLWCVVQCCFVQ
jgi:hypothetical protein